MILKETQRRIHRASLLLMASIFISRLIGFFRELALAHTLGATAMTDVYLASFTIPDFLNYLVATGALSISFIPILSSFLDQGQKETAEKVFRAIGTWAGGVLVILIVLAEIFAGSLAPLVAPGFNESQRETLTYLIRIILPAQFFFFWGGLATSVQHTHGRFFIPALAPILYNIGIIFFGVTLHSRFGVAGFSFGVLIGSIVGNGVVQWWGIRQLGYSCLPYFGASPEIKTAFLRYVWLSLPIMLGFSLVATDEWIAKYFASRLGEPFITYLGYARIEMRIPVGILGQVAGIASFPFLARLWAQNNYGDYATTLLREIKKLWAVGPLAAILLINHALPITHFIYGGGRLTLEDLEATAAAVKMFGVGVVFWLFQVLLARGFYASQRTWLPSLLGTLISVIAIPLYAVLANAMGHSGLALAGSLGIAFYTVCLWLLLKRHLKRYCETLSYKPLYSFFFAWSLAVAGLYLISKAIALARIYRNTQFSGLAEILIATAVLGGIALFLLRRVFHRLTDGVLF